jgi:hypothetical protein
MSVGAQNTEREQNVLCIERPAAVGDNSGEISDMNVQGTVIAIQYRYFRLGTETPRRLVDIWGLRRHPVCSPGGRAEV